MNRKCRKTWAGFSVQAFFGLWGFFKSPAASAVMLCLETWYFQVLVLIVGLLENAEIALDSLPVCITISGWVYMISVVFNAAASVRVSNELGAGHNVAVRKNLDSISNGGFRLNFNWPPLRLKSN